MSDDTGLGWKEGAAERIAAAIAGEWDGPCFVGSYVVMFEGHNGQGDRVVGINVMPDQRQTETLGLLSFFGEMVRTQVADEWRDAWEGE